MLSLRSYLVASVLHFMYCARMLNLVGVPSKRGTGASRFAIHTGVTRNLQAVIKDTFSDFIHVTTNSSR